MPLNMAVPEAVTPEASVGVEAPDTTRVEPPLLGVRKANTSLPTVSAYQVLLLQDEAE